MRASINGEKRARRDAQRAHREQQQAPPPPSSRTGWSTKEPPRRKLSASERELQERADLQRRRWAAQNRGAAQAERQLRKSNAEIQDRFGHKANGTPATHAEARQHFEHGPGKRTGALARLFFTGAIDKDQLAAAVDIATAAEQLGADVRVRTASLETRVDIVRHGGNAFFERLGQVRREIAYTRWRKALGPSVAPVLDMIVGDAEGYSVVAKRYRMHARKAKALLIAALDLWPSIAKEVVDEVDAATLAAAHAGLV